MKHKILWEKWVNPYEISLEDGNLLENIDSNEFDEESPWEEYADDLEEDVAKFQIQKQTKAIITPMGMIPINEKTACTKTFKFWIGHTNFSISANHQDIIESTEGVEILDIFTRYRFRIAIGKAFQDRDVMQAIQDNLYEKL